MWKRWLCLSLVAACITTALAAIGRPEPAAKLKITEVSRGVGHKAAVGDLVTVLYEGKLADGTVFDSNFAKDASPFAFHLGRSEVIAGWDQGVAGMAKSGERRLQIPPELGYGDRAQAKIPAGSTLYFKVRVLDIVAKGDEGVFDKTELKIGTGKVAKNGSTVTVDYVGKLVNGKVFDSTYDTKRSVTFKLGAGDALKAIDMGIRGMREGGKRRLRIPPAIAFGPMGSMPRGVPGNAVVIYDIELRKVGKSKS